MKDRIIRFIEAEKLTAAEFADTIGVQRSSVSHVLNGRNNPGFSFIQKILESYPNLNSRWLLTGEGSMYEKTNSVVSSKQEDPKLFDIKKTEPQNALKMNNTPHTNEKEFNVTETDSPQKVSISPLEKENKTVIRVLIFYNDQTFDDFRPAK